MAGLSVPANNPSSACGATSFLGYRSFPKLVSYCTEMSHVRRLGKSKGLTPSAVLLSFLSVKGSPSNADKTFFWLIELTRHPRREWAVFAIGFTQTTNAASAMQDQGSALQLNGIFSFFVQKKIENFLIVW